MRVSGTRIENSVNDGCGNWEALFVSPFTGMVKQESKWEYEYVPYLCVRSLCRRTIRMHARESEFGFGLSCRPVRLTLSLSSSMLYIIQLRSTSSWSVWVGLMTAALPRHNAITSKCLVALVGNGSKAGNEQRSKSLRLLPRNKEPFLKIAFPIICSTSIGKSRSLMVSHYSKQTPFHDEVFGAAFGTIHFLFYLSGGDNEDESIHYRNVCLLSRTAVTSTCQRR